jgi:FkbM family methyltransferase
MIDINYNEGIKITTGQLSKVFKQDQLPLKFQIKGAISKKIVWEVELKDDMWANYGENEINDVVVIDNNGKFVTQYYWDLLSHGSIFYKSLWFYCKSLINNGINPNGLVIGAHDGEFGEWVPLVRNHMSDILLIEGSSNTFNRLKENYYPHRSIKLVNTIVTPNGGPVEFFEGGRGYTNSVVERVIRNWEIEEINSKIYPSESINKYLTPNINWLHLDVEGLDAELILNSNYLPNFIIFEDFNLLIEQKTKVYDFLKDKGYVLHSEHGICMANK